MTHQIDKKVFDYNENNNKKQRNLLTISQTEILRNIFSRTQYPRNEEVVQISNKLNLPVLKINNWFKNQRQLKKLKFKTTV